MIVSPVNHFRNDPEAQNRIDSPVSTALRDLLGQPRIAKPTDAVVRPIRGEWASFFMGRALAAYFRSGATEQPSKALSNVFSYKNREYVRLMNVRGALAVYRIREGYYDARYDCWRHQLRRLKRWPRAMVA